MVVMLDEETEERELIEQHQEETSDGARIEGDSEYKSSVVEFEDGAPRPKKIAVSNLMMPISSSQQQSSIHVTRGIQSPSTLDTVMESYGKMMGHMAKAMIEGVGPQLTTVVHLLQVIFF